MSCEHYQNALVEAAASGAEPQGELRAHLEVCPSCHTAFAREHALFSSIDVGLHVTASAEVPASLLPRVRAHLDEQPVAEHNWVPAWMIIGATAALIVLAIARQSKRPDTVSPDSQKSTVAQKASPAVVPAAPVEAPSGIVRRRRATKRTRPAMSGASASVEQVSVLLPAGQKEALDDLLASLQRGQVNGEVLLAQNQILPLEDLRISPLDVSSIQVKPLTYESGASPSSNTDSKH
jgi:hypothetical protein